MFHSVSCIALNEVQARSIANDLKAAGFRDSEISVLFPQPPREGTLVFEESTKAPEGAAIGAGTGGVLGGTLGWLVGIGTIAIPGLGPFIAAGPILAALGGAAAGAAVGGVTGSLVGLGVPEIEARTYERSLQEGKILISVHCATDEEVERATDVMLAASAHDISTPIHGAVN